MLRSLKTKPCSKKLDRKLGTARVKALMVIPTTSIH